MPFSMGFLGVVGHWGALEYPLARCGPRSRVGFKYRNVRANAVMILPIEARNRAGPVTFDPKPGGDVEKYDKLLLEIAG